MKPIYLLGVLGCLLGACQPSISSLPIEEEKLIQVLTDVHIAEAGLQNLRGAVKDSTAILYYNQIYSIHGITEDDFMQSIEILKQDPKRMNAIYTLVLDNLSVREASATNVKTRAVN
ncbi:MAG: DUF4296 domain-containing protein [Bacteroidota bacterium]